MVASTVSSSIPAISTSFSSPHSGYLFGSPSDASPPGLAPLDNSAGWMAPNGVRRQIIGWDQAVPRAATARITVRWVRGGY